MRIMCFGIVEYSKITTICTGLSLNSGVTHGLSIGVLLESTYMYLHTVQLLAFFLIGSITSEKQDVNNPIEELMVSYVSISGVAADLCSSSSMTGVHFEHHQGDPCPIYMICSVYCM